MNEYPREAAKPYGTLWFNAGRVRMDADSRQDERFLEYMVDTIGGQSGSRDPYNWQFS
jgi:glutamyl endopeptidase